jgi:hypothetical protein
VRGRKAQEYGNISRLSDEAMGHFGQIPAGRWNGFHLGQMLTWKGNQPSLRDHPPDMFAIPAPRGRGE